MNLKIAKELGLGGCAPIQGEGFLSDGRQYYFRIRHQNATLWVGPPGAKLDQCRRIGVNLSGANDDPHIWSYLPHGFDGTPDHCRPLLNLLIWTLENIELGEVAEEAE